MRFKKQDRMTRWAEHVLRQIPSAQLVRREVEMLHEPPEFSNGKTEVKSRMESHSQIICTCAVLLQ